MTRTMIAAAALLSASAASATERSYSVTDFDRIQVEGPFQVTLVTGKPSSAIASGTAQALERLSVSVQGRVLKIRPNRSAWGGYPGEQANVPSLKVSTHGLRSASVTGSGSIAIDRARAMKFDAAVSGSGRIGIGAVEADILSLGLLGAGRIEIGGKAKSLRATIAGSGDLVAPGLTVEDAELNADTSGTIALAVRRAAKVTASGAGDVTIAGTPACTLNGLGSGRVTCGK